MPVITCKKCKGYYKLKEGELLEDFESCSCGGDLEDSWYDYAFLYAKDPGKNINLSQFFSDMKAPLLEVLNFSKLRRIPDKPVDEHENSAPRTFLINSAQSPKFGGFKMEYLYYLILVLISICSIYVLFYIYPFSI